MKYSYRFPLPNNSFFEEEVTSSTRVLIEEAIAQNYHVDIPEGTRLVIFSKDGRSAIMQAQTPDTTSYIAYYATEDKGVCRSLLEKANIQVPKGYTIRIGQTKEDWIQVFESLRKPLVIKPTHGMKGEQVFMDIDSSDEFVKSVTTCFKFPRGEGSGVVVEEQFKGQEYRIIATREKTLAIINRVPANVIGDGSHSVKDLIITKNQDPRRCQGEQGSLSPILIDDILVKKLADQGLNLDSIVNKNEQIFLRSNSNISTGGDSVDITDSAHDSVKRLAVAAVRAIPGLSFAGIDFITTNITAPQSANSYVIIEINKSPSFIIHEQPFQGTSRPISKELLKLLFS